MQEIAQINIHFCDIFAAPLVQTGFRIQIDVIMTSTTLEGRGCDFGGFAGYNTLNDFWPLLLFLHNHSSMLFLHFLFLCSFSFLFISLNDYFFILDFHDIWAVLINDTFMIIFLTQPLRYFSPSIIHYTVFWITYCWFFIPPRIFIAHASMLSCFHFFFHFSTHFLHRSSTIFFSFSFVFHFFSFSFLSFPYQFLINSLSSLSIPSLALWTLSIVQRTGTPKWMISRICSNQKDSSRHVSSFSLFCLVSISRLFWLFWLFCCLFMVFPYCSSFGERVCVMVQRNLKNLQKNDSPQPHKLVPPCDFTTIHLSIPWSFCIPCSNI